MRGNKTSIQSVDFAVKSPNPIKVFKLKKESIINQIANIITLFRILFGICLLFFPVFSAAFYTFYILGGFTDMIDGTVARKTNSVSKFGAKLDTVADFIFVFFSLIKVLPAIHISEFLWVWCGIIAVIKIGNICLGFVRYKKFLTQHTLANKITGLFLFLSPLTLHFFKVQYIASLLCTVATFSALLETCYISSGREII